jgi:NAD(P)-dependent dehydrogenase (short-subunit alcohol dehydrogenase family)
VGGNKTVQRRHENKIVLITAGASGIGEATVRGFAAEGAKVIIADINEDAGNTVADELTKAGCIVRFCKSDATREADAEALVNYAVAEFGRLDIAINNVGNLGAGQSPWDKLHETGLDAWKSTVDLNLTSCFLGMKHQILQMLRQGGGVIANTASMAAMRVSQDAPASYAAAKAGVIHLSEHAAVLYAADNIRINVVAPGLTATPAIVAQIPLDKQREMAKRTQPMGRMMLPEEQAAAFLWVCSDEASGVTGLTIPVAGGWAAV